jgi:putative colanic acid biosynthesis UDP-glucose lipid carrier transferase
MTGSLSASLAPVAGDAARALPVHAVHHRRGAVYRTAETPIGGAAKRAIDLVLALIALTIAAPMLAVFAILIRLESRGPVIFTQWRAGFRGRAFRIYKLRTMAGRHSGRGLRQAQRKDPRVTRLGAFLRRTSIDELPQIINVLKGDMSIVGPRPHAISHECDFRRAAEDYALRRMARPGLTGLAQVSGARGLTDTPEKLARRIHYDLAYVRRWSLALDFWIMIRTALVVLRDPAAH